MLDDLSYYSDRDEFKEKLFGRIFYCYETGLWTTNENEQFKVMFPNVARIISYYKKDSYKNLPRLLQSIESEIMIKNVVGHLMNENIYALTIHDSILCLPEYSERVKNIMEEEFQKVIGLKPQIRIK